MKHQCISVLANATLPFSGLSLRSGSGFMPLVIPRSDMIVDIGVGGTPDECVDLLNSMLDFVVRIGGLDA